MLGYLRRFAVGLAAALTFSSAPLVSAQVSAEAGPVVEYPEVRAELVVHAPEGLLPGRPAWLGLQFDHAPEWHTYWLNPGDSGLPTTMAWQLPPGFSTGDIDWPAPHGLPVGPMLNYGYEGRLVLPVPVEVPADWNGGPLQIGLAADWLICRTECIPQSGQFLLSINDSALAQLAHAAAFEASFAQRPQLHAEQLGFSLSTEPATGPDALPRATAVTLQVPELPSEWAGRAVRAYPEQAGVFNHPGDQAYSWSDSSLEITVPVSPYRMASPDALGFVLRAEGIPQTLRVLGTLSPNWPQAASADRVDAALLELATVGGGVPMGLGVALLAAVVGGMLLNLMPCVFPVLSIKILGVVQLSQSPAALRRNGVFFTVGVLSSMLALAAVLIALRAAGEQLGWGFQLQSPLIVFGLAALFTLIALNLLGVFEIGMLIPQSWAGAHAKHPDVDAFLSGVLAVAVASPCTAPFMGASLGFALTLSPAGALLVFAALGLGVALPYFLATLFPNLAGRLPRPGPWMAHFRTLMAFPMLATVIWLLWVLGEQNGGIAMTSALGLLLAVSLAVWLWSTSSTARRKSWRAGALLSAFVLVVVTARWAWPTLSQPAGTLLPNTAAVAGAPQADGEPWQAWTAQGMQDLLRDGHVVFVDYTAAWCVTCQFNKRTVFADPEVMQAFAQAKVVTLRADWTRRDPDITEALARVGRQGVPVYAFYQVGRSPLLLSELPSRDEIIGALASVNPAR